MLTHHLLVILGSAKRYHNLPTSSKSAPSSPASAVNAMYPTTSPTRVFTQRYRRPTLLPSKREFGRENPRSYGNSGESETKRSWPSTSNGTRGTSTRCWNGDMRRCVAGISMRTFCFILDFFFGISLLRLRREVKFSTGCFCWVFKLWFMVACVGWL